MFSDSSLKPHIISEGEEESRGRTCSEIIPVVLPHHAEVVAVLTEGTGLGGLLVCSYKDVLTG